MWIFFNDSFLSVVAHKSQPDSLLVRARAAGDIEAVFPDAVVAHTPSHDYAYRAVVPRNRVASVFFGRVVDINYSNFKDSVPETDRHDIYFDVWRAMMEFQRIRKGR